MFSETFPSLVILARYGLDGRKEAQLVHSNSLSDSTQDDGLGDPRLEKLWHKVPLSFSITSGTYMSRVKAWVVGISAVPCRTPVPLHGIHHVRFSGFLGQCCSLVIVLSFQQLSLCFLLEHSCFLYKVISLAYSYQTVKF